MKQNKILAPHALLTSNGAPAEYGYAFKPIVTTNKQCLGVSRFRYKEWDFYQITNPSYTLQITLGHVSYAGGLNFTLFDYSGKNRYSATLPLIFPMEIGLADTAGTPYVLEKKTKNFYLKAEVEDGKRTFICKAKSSHGDCRAELTLSYPKDDDGILVVTPFVKPVQFYHNYKQCCMLCSGYISFGDKVFNFEPTDSFGLIDWGRGTMPYAHKWWWSNCSTIIDGNRFGFNLGVFGNTSFATENTLFFNGQAHKIDVVSYTRNSDDIMIPWEFVSSDERFKMTFSPIFDNFTKTFALIVNNKCHQVFGKWSGFAILDDGSKVEVKDMLGFVEEAHNHW